MVVCIQPFLRFSLVFATYFKMILLIVIFIKNYS